MKQIVISISTIAILSSLAIAGKNTIPAPSEPLKIPEPATTVNNNGSVNLENLPLGLYLGGGLTYAKSECKCNQNVTFSNNSVGKTNKATTYGVNLKAGYDYNKFIGIEAKYLHTPWGDDGKALKHYGIYLKPNYAVDENIDLYGLLGYGKTECETLQDSKKGFAWGLGGEYTIENSKDKNKGVGIYVEYLRPLKKKTPNEITTNVANVGVAYHY